MNRRSFLYTTFFISNITNADYISLYHDEFLVIDSVLEHMFDATDIVPRYKDTDMIKFVAWSIFHPSYDIEIREFVLAGARELLVNYKDFLKSNKFQKEIYLRRFEDIRMGQSWLYRIQILGMEAIYSAPVYGVNHQCRYYGFIDAKAGEPMPKCRYIEI